MSHSFCASSLLRPVKAPMFATHASVVHGSRTVWPPLAPHSYPLPFPRYSPRASPLSSSAPSPPFPSPPPAPKLSAMGRGRIKEGGRLRRRGKGRGRTGREGTWMGPEGNKGPKGNVRIPGDVARVRLGGTTKYRSMRRNKKSSFGQQRITWFTKIQSFSARRETLLNATRRS